MPTIPEYIKKFANLKLFLNEEFPKILLEISQNNVAALVVNRVTQTQTNYKGQKFSQYSTTKLPVFFFEKSALTASGQTAVQKLRAFGKKQREELTKTLNNKNTPGPVKEAASKKLRENEGISYAEFRRLIGRINTNKDFQLSGEMWLKFGVKREVKAAGKFTVVLGGTTQIAQNKIDWNSKRERLSIIENSKEEEKIVLEVVRKIFNNRIANINF